ncbi:MAG: response regulator [Candidatus Marinimicrobia bacterium]|jgi:two-component system, OmpR family, aerobic respiration control sensor histidine kinase ArcB|nr:response regulator [Candidatus Neomarinimicrobiota bacterium]MBT4362015.1 response regulator [Candidatus Neomarinimicrobiota bacterium]MBT4713392.1 response regulator [Candidatus Neomarinimicrobiota bacterium]MBT4945977.1 response regulator [Candidatus Neomarinimicrobiota bacterium]MBT5269653.1 response regulator [Candidatus Neomarinimicrobiota bacterium]
MEYLNTKKTLLVVEDDKGWTLILKHMLKNRNVEAIYAETGEEALQLIDDREDVSCVFLDVSLGDGISGLELGALLKTKQDFKDTPMIAMTAHDERVIGDYEEVGFTGYLQKPYSLDQLGDLLDTHHLDNRTAIHLN